LESNIDLAAPRGVLVDLCLAKQVEIALGGELSVH